ncbi:MAG: zf-HC2 domain-containing protein [Myxococcales bacterium]|nr:zf-HC2 domain-containing protein [Myxococcales bacterium]MCB9709462.1 zf-HC2 domain-containing protein [Myxococcales bacterium]
MKCSVLREDLDAYLDGECSASSRIEFESHLLRCDGCRDLMDALNAQRACVRRAFLDEGTPSEVKERLQRRFFEEAEEWDAPYESHAPLIRFVPMQWKYVLPTAALGVALFSVLRVVDDSGVQEAATGSIGLFGEVERLHAHRLPMDIEDAEALPAYFSDKVPVPVYAIAFDQGSVRFSGARYAQIQQKPAATLYYLSDGRRITVVVSESYPYGRWRQGKKVSIGGRDIYYYRVAGRTISAFEDNGVLYTFAGDLPPRQMLKLAGSMHVR